MIESKISYLKNVIFFKFIIYIIVYILLISLMPSLIRDNVKSAVEIMLASEMRDATSSKVNILQSKGNVLGSLYSSLEKALPLSNSACIEKSHIEQNLKTLNNLPKHFKIEYISENKINKNLVSSPILKYLNYKITFSAKSFDEFLETTNEIYSKVLPTNSMLTEFKAVKQSIITPKDLYSLEENATSATSLGLITGYANFQVRVLNLNSN